uniref:UDP-glucose:glycoprotein glucosyltransferase 1 n=1 Tax=Myxine glutinosa TaxID=7769 RepID=UPI00358F5325
MPPMAVLFFCLAVLTSPIYPVFSSQLSSKGVTATLDAKWPHTHLLLEASEFLAEEGEETFWEFVQTVLDFSYVQALESQLYDLLIKKAAQFLSPVQLSLLKFSLSMRTYSPTVHMCQQLAEEESPPVGCEAFIVVHGKTSCVPEDLTKLLISAGDRPRPMLFKGDHKFPGAGDPPVVILLYAQIGTAAFSSFHHLLAKLAQAGDLVYVLRHYVEKPSDMKVRLSGYGVELAIKSTEYKAKDDTQVKDGNVNASVLEVQDVVDDIQGFLFGKLKQIHPEVKDNLQELRTHLVESTNEMAPLKVWQLQDLSFQTAARVMSAPKGEGLRVLRDLSQNFPNKARTLTRTKVSSDMRNEIEENQKYFSGSHGIHPGESALFINGLNVDLDLHDPFTVLEIVREDGRVLEGLQTLGLRGHLLADLLGLGVNPPEGSHALDIRQDAILWINNIEEDRRYSNWPINLQELLRPTFPGVIRQIRKNLYNLVLVLDPEQAEAKELIKLAEMFYQHNIPLRLGLVFVVNAEEQVDGNEDPGVALVRAFNFVSLDSDNSKAFSTIVSMYDRVEDGDLLTVADVVSVLAKKYPSSDPKHLLGLDSDYDDSRTAGSMFYKRVGLGTLPQALFNGAPYTSEELQPDDFETITVQKIMDAMTFFQRAVYMGELTNRMDVVEFLMDQPGVVPRFNPLILASERKYLDLTSSQDRYDINDPKTFVHLDLRDKNAAIEQSMRYITKRDEDAVHPVTIWVVGDFDHTSGRELLYSAVKHVKSSSGVQLSLINNPGNSSGAEAWPVARALWATLTTQIGSHAKNMVTKLAKEENARAIESGTPVIDFAVHGMDVAAFERANGPSMDGPLRSHMEFARSVLKLRPGERAVVCNGRVVGPLPEGEPFTQEDFLLLEKVTTSTSAQKILHKLEGNWPDGVRNRSNLIMKVDALLSAAPKSEPRTSLNLKDEQYSVLKLRPKENEVYFDVVAVIDPVTYEAQRLTSLLLVLREVLNLNLRIFMNCRAKLSEMPLKSFYRYVLEAEPKFSPHGDLLAGPLARFADMPGSPLFTLNMITPESWLVESVRTPYDLDNIYLNEVEGVVAAQFELEYLLLEGHCHDVSTGQPPRGLQFTLGSRKQPLTMDTIVMANLGYFQLKANPGAWILQLRKGRSDDICTMFSHEGTDSPPDASDVIVLMKSFKSKIIKVRVQKKPHKMHEELLGDAERESGGIWNSIRSLAGGGQTEDSDKDQDGVINIFSVASGHLYERFLRIMMLSVLKHTHTPVKFWFLKNFLSPTFKEFIPAMAQAYGFKYEFVQYNWPRWLHQQREKQRIIWGYKILFLDVLFPLAVDKIIFVDADQIVRTDLKELRNLPLDGAPYGYTPFCDSRRDMDGYRFWRSGYWASHLAGRKYHISALYVVDLRKFRKIAAGDRLRGQYQALSQDPNSLSNLDQDLPNNMIHQVPIKSLPQDWLWCETWCSDASKERAKTIDLCNNPMTKEPKLTAAMRIVPEWNSYDAEVKRLWKEVMGGEHGEVTNQGEGVLEDASPSTTKQKKLQTKGSFEHPAHEEF